MTVLDAHAHLYHPSWYPAPFNHFLIRDFRRRASARAASIAPARESVLVGRLLSDATGEATVRLMDKVGIDRRVIAVLDWGVAMGEADKAIRQIHEEILSICRRFADRLVGFATVDPRRADAMAIVRYAVDELGARGLKLHPTSSWSLEDEVVHALVTLAEERQLPVLVHVGRTMEILDDRQAHPEALVSLAKRFPRVTFIAGHSGFEQWRRFDVADLPGNLRFDIAGWQDLRPNDAGDRTAAIVEIVSAFPARVHFGTDSPFFTYNLLTSESAWLNLVRNSPLPAGALEPLLSGRGLGI